MAAIFRRLPSARTKMREPTSHCISPAASQKSSDLALVWLMLATQLDERAASPRDARARPGIGRTVGSTPFLSL
jgi:hypothetical protein